ncbi:ABC transporter ATP-binding protein [Rhodopirellula sp. MGV]|uniref:ABC transporter ATP-binding protein n=1 Tax=Rhodopirellula sp. MGV TaxID=2023130 RepID=UPI000B97A12F|nr:ABC transporter ATP-binding protein [Rhodopirellula sp. MGV]OYP39168.1 hypothetical protein CGZ80_00530 [Rhodopirellula sp. MGV]
MTTSIRIDQLSKRYKLGLTHAGSIRELANAVLGRLFNNGTTSHRQHRSSERAGDQTADSGYFWALRQISFEVDQGDVVGIVGKNGAGKSTLLKLLSRITYPTSGRAELVGRVASLLEVGTGFHPELTGRENVFLNGTILGMTRHEIQRQLDDIVEFAGVAKFLDTPVKRYSSGMKVRLGFAVAAHLNPEILIVDEVLAVGDVEFQRRCLGKMQSVAESGKTVLFVSHNLASVRALTNRCVVLSHGQVAFDGDTDEAVNVYIQENLSGNSESSSVADLPRSFSGLCRQLEFVDLQLEQTDDIDGQPFRFTATIRANSQCRDFLLGITVFDANQNPVGSTFTETAEAPSSGNCREYHFDASFDLAPGQYHCAISIADAASQGKRIYDSVSEVMPFRIELPVTDLRGWHAGWGPVRLPQPQLLNCDPVTR